MGRPGVLLKPKRERSVLRHHPWVFSGAIARLKGGAADGDVVEVWSAGGEWLARGVLNTRSQIAVRLLTWEREEEADASLWRERLRRAAARRHDLLQDPRTTLCRIVHAESDGLPGLVVDRYGEYLVVQFLALSADQWREATLDWLEERFSPKGILERSDVPVVEKEGLPARVGLLRGQEPPPRLAVQENGIQFLVDMRAGQKTGFYIDQRENRARLEPFCAGVEVLDGFCYTGSFGLYALRGGAAQATFVDSSRPALDIGRENLTLNGADPHAHAFVEGNIFQVLRRFRTEGRRFDLILLDPPKFAPSARDVRRASRAYKDINLLAFQLLRPDGVLFSTSCSGAISPDLFQKILFGAALDAGREAQIIGHLHQAADHPVRLSFPEGMYLKGLICRVE